MYETGRFANISREQVGRVANREDFIDVVEKMSADLAAEPDAWENATLPRFLEALAAAAVGLDGLYANRDEPLPDPPGWRQLAELLVIASGYE